MRLKLRPYQLQGLNDIRDAFRRAIKALLYVLPTGGGKTVIYAAIAEGAAAKGNRVLILEHRKELIRQASLALASIGVKHQLVMPDNKINRVRAAHVKRFGWPMIDRNSTVAVASVQTLARRMEWLDEFDPDLIIIDEAHHATAGTWAVIIARCIRAFLLGVTATPKRRDGKPLRLVFQEMVMGPSPKELIEDGYLLRPRVICPPIKADLSNVHRNKDDELDPDEAAEAMLASREITGDAIEHYARLAPGKAAIVFCFNKHHAHEVAAQFREAGWLFEVIHGEMDDAQRDDLIYGLADGKYQGLVSVDVISEGTDIPVAEVAIMLRLTESEVYFLQAAGRVLRPLYADGFDQTTREGRLDAIEASGKPYGLIIDHVGNCGKMDGNVFVAKHGRPHDDREWSLEGRKKSKRKKASEVAMVQCPKCYLCHDPAPKCPGCGHKYENQSNPQGSPDVVAGTLLDVPDDVAVRMEARRAQGRAQTAEDLIKQGMSKERANHILQARKEKTRLQSQAVTLLQKWAKLANQTVLGGWGFPMSEIGKMKPKQLQETIERANEAILKIEFPEQSEQDPNFSIRTA